MRHSYYPDPRDNPKWKSMSADERAANAQQHIQEALASVVKLFESGDVPAAVQKMSFPPANIPMAHWSLGNRLICWMHGTLDARGFKQWQEVGRSVKKGAHAFYILRPKLVKDKDDIDEETGEAATKFVGTVPVAVFRVEDTDGDPVDYGLPEMPAHTFLDVAKAWGIDVGLTPGGGGAYGWYSPGTKAIRLATADESTFMHELAHAADDRLQGGLQGGQDPVQEICAELSSAALCLLVGLEDKGYNPGRSFEYISSYARKLYPDAPARDAVAKACARVVARVGKIMGLIIDTATGGTRKNPEEILEAVGPYKLAEILAHIAAGGRMVVAGQKPLYVDQKAIDAWRAQGKTLLRAEGRGYRLRRGKSSVYLFPEQVFLVGGPHKNPRASVSLDAAARHLAQASHVLPEATDAAEELGVHDDLMDAEGAVVGAEARVRELADYARERGNPEVMSRADAVKYARAIRNAAKKSYAEKWIRFVYDGAPEPESPADLGFMGAQAVRLAIPRPRDNPIHGYQDEDTSGDAAIRQAAKHLEKLVLSGAGAAEIREASAKYRALRGNPAMRCPKIPQGVKPYAGDEGWEHVPAPTAGQILFTTCPDSGKLEGVEILGAGSDFDQCRGVRYRWVTGPETGLVEDRYGRAFWRLRKNPALPYPKIQRSDIESEHPTGRPSVGSLVWVQDLGDAVVAGYYRGDVVVHPTGDSPLADEGGYYVVPCKALGR